VLVVTGGDADDVDDDLDHNENEDEK